MALTSDQKAQIRSVVEASLDEAENVWKEHGVAVNKAMFEAAADSAMVRKAELVPSRIPGHDVVNSDHPAVEDFIVLMADMRDSSQHLLQAISGTRNDATGLKRVYLETNALLPALELTVGYRDGRITEYLGDGVLGLFRAPKDTLGDVITDAYHAADNCIKDTRDIVNSILIKRYALPRLSLGVGLGYSPALVQTVGLSGVKHAKAIGRCVYNASKLSKGINEVRVDKALEYAWPTSKEGTLRFAPLRSGPVEGFVVSRAAD